ncbi:hypothetical protein ANH9381_0470 [Aggregatibacter actinomycetemcomitans ANH9381]|nr:hypothetical protein ANH9381_0470 [Aggregatibacter actinomycetemcomitans ANH9381]
MKNCVSYSKKRFFERKNAENFYRTLGVKRVINLIFYRILT